MKKERKPKNAKIKIPSYKIVESSLNYKNFVGYTYKVHLAENVFILIEYLNYQLIKPNGKPSWKFSFCNIEEHSFSSIILETDEGAEKSYYLGIKWLLKTSKSFEHIFKNFNSNSIIIL